MAMSFGGLSEKQGRCLPSLLLLLLLHIAHGTSARPVTSCESLGGREMQLLFLLKCGEQSKNSYYLI